MAAALYYKSEYTPRATYGVGSGGGEEKEKEEEEEEEEEGGEEVEEEEEGEGEEDEALNPSPLIRLLNLRPPLSPPPPPPPQPEAPALASVQVQGDTTTKAERYRYRGASSSGRRRRRSVHTGVGADGGDVEDEGDGYLDGAVDGDPDREHEIQRSLRRRRGLSSVSTGGGVGRDVGVVPGGEDRKGKGKQQELQEQDQQQKTKWIYHAPPSPFTFKAQVKKPSLSRELRRVLVGSEVSRAGRSASPGAAGRRKVVVLGGKREGREESLLGRTGGNRGDGRRVPLVEVDGNMENNFVGDTCNGAAKKIWTSGTSKPLPLSSRVARIPPSTTISKTKQQQPPPLSTATTPANLLHKTTAARKKHVLERAWGRRSTDVSLLDISSAIPDAPPIEPQVGRSSKRATSGVRRRGVVATGERRPVQPRKGVIADLTDYRGEGDAEWGLEMAGMGLGLGGDSWVAKVPGSILGSGSGSGSQKGSRGRGESTDSGRRRRRSGGVRGVIREEEQVWEDLDGYEDEDCQSGGSSENLGQGRQRGGALNEGRSMFVETGSEDFVRWIKEGDIHQLAPIPTQYQPRNPSKLGRGSKDASPTPVPATAERPPRLPSNSSTPRPKNTAIPSNSHPVKSWLDSQVRSPPSSIPPLHAPSTRSDSRRTHQNLPPSTTTPSSTESLLAKKYPLSLTSLPYIKHRLQPDDAAKPPPPRANKAQRSTTTSSVNTAGGVITVSPPKTIKDSDKSLLSPPSLLSLLSTPTLTPSVRDCEKAATHPTGGGFIRLDLRDKKFVYTIFPPSEKHATTSTTIILLHTRLAPSSSPSAPAAIVRKYLSLQDLPGKYYPIIRFASRFVRIVRRSVAVVRVEGRVGSRAGAGEKPRGGKDSRMGVGSGEWEHYRAEVFADGRFRFEVFPRGGWVSGEEATVSSTGSAAAITAGIGSAIGVGSLIVEFFPPSSLLDPAPPSSSTQRKIKVTVKQQQQQQQKEKAKEKSSSKTPQPNMLHESLFRINDLEQCLPRGPPATEVGIPSSEIRWAWRVWKECERLM